LWVGWVGLSEDFVTVDRQKGAQPIGIDRLPDKLWRGDFELAAIGRAPIANPHWAEKVQAGRFDQLVTIELKAFETLWPIFSAICGLTRGRRRLVSGHTAPERHDEGFHRLQSADRRGLARRRARALKRAEKQGLIGAHHFRLTFKTHFPGVEIPDFLREQYPDEMTIILQHQFWG
jgi:hypothetical protein